jgi:CBS domain-containing protein
MKVADVMTKDVVTVGPVASLKEVAALLVEHGISGVPVVDAEGCALGVVTEADILRKERIPPRRSRTYVALHPAEIMEEELRTDARTAGEAMTTPAKVIAGDRPVAEAAARMLDEGVNRLPVVEDDRVVGIVTRADLVRAFVRSDAEIAREIREDILLRTIWTDPSTFALSVERGHVALRGRVDTAADADLIPALAARVPGVVSVRAELTSHPG